MTTNKNHKQDKHLVSSKTTSETMCTEISHPKYRQKHSSLIEFAF